MAIDFKLVDEGCQVGSAHHTGLEITNNGAHVANAVIVVTQKTKCLRVYDYDVPLKDAIEKTFGDMQQFDEITFSRPYDAAFEEELLRDELQGKAY